MGEHKQPRKVNVSYELKRYAEVINKLEREKIITKEEFLKAKNIHQTAMLRWVGIDINQIDTNVEQ